MRPYGPAIAAAVVLGVQGAALIVLSLVELVALGAGGTASTAGGVGLIVLTLLAAAALVAFGVGVLRRSSWARSGGIVFQVLGIALGLAGLGIRPLPWLFVAGVGGSAVVGLILLIAATRRDGASDPRLRARDEADDH